MLGRAAKLFDHVTVAVADNPGKRPLFSTAQRLRMLRPNLAKFPNVKVTHFGGPLTDFEFEFNMALMNRHLQPEIETIFVMPNEQFSYTSSSLVKQVAKYCGDVSHFVPPNVAAALKKAYKCGD